METTTGSITLGDKTYTATKVGYEAIETITGEITLTSNGTEKTHTATKVEIVEQPPL